MQKIAIIGSGISGLVAAHCLANGTGRDFRPDPSIERCAVTVFERDSRIGGHTATIDVEHQARQYAIDTGFIVYNDWTYPNFIRLLDQLGVASQTTSMSFSVSCEKTGLEYAGSNYNTLFARRRNALSPSFLRMLLDIVRFNREAIADLESGRLDPAATLGDYLEKNRYSDYFADKYLVPMGSAIWSSGDSEMRDFPLLFFVRFFKNHGLLSIKNRPQWRTLIGGSRSYLEPLTAGFADSIRLNADIASVQRHDAGVTLRMADGSSEQFDGVVFATHSDQALALLDDADAAEQSILGAMPYQENEVVLHTDHTLLPARRLAWSAWNYRLSAADGDTDIARLTYDMNILQNIESPTTFCVSLNQTAAIDERCILGEYRYSHPVFSVEGIAAQQRWHEIAGQRQSWYCGAYWRNGFHEDGVVSALDVVDSIRAQQRERLAAAS